MIGFSPHLVSWWMFMNVKNDITDNEIQIFTGMVQGVFFPGNHFFRFMGKSIRLPVGVPAWANPLLYVIWVLWVCLKFYWKIPFQHSIHWFTIFLMKIWPFGGSQFSDKSIFQLLSQSSGVTVNLQYLNWLEVESYPSEQYEFVSWDDDIPNIWKNKIHVPNHQPVMIITSIIPLLPVFIHY